MKITIDPLFDIGSIVYLKTDNNQHQRIITGFCIREGGIVSYEVSCDERSSWHYGFELSHEKDILKTITN
jgi:hypothetical protein